GRGLSGRSDPGRGFGLHRRLPPEGTRPGGRPRRTGLPARPAVPGDMLATLGRGGRGEGGRRPFPARCPYYTRWRAVHEALACLATATSGGDSTGAASGIAHPNA